jgi:hypothetical protein
MFNRLLRGPGRRGRDQGDGPLGGRRGRAGGTKPGSGPDGECVCPSCGHKLPHQAGQRCLDIPCPKCGTRMVRE